MIGTYSDAMNRGVFPHEGGYTNDAEDPGGPTNWGITIADARMYWKPTATAEDVRSMPKEIAISIYAKHYAAPVRYNDLPAGVDYSVLDYAINSGVGRAGKVLRRLVGLPDTSSAITDDVIAVVLRRDNAMLINQINDERLAFLKTLKNWPTYQNGWTRRVSECRALSLSFALSVKPPIISNQPASGKAVPPAAAPIPAPVKPQPSKGPPAAALALLLGAIVSAAAAIKSHPNWTALAVFLAVGAVVAIVIHHKRKSQ